MSVRSILLASSALITLAVAGPALAETAAPSSLSEVVVTASPLGGASPTIVEQVTHDQIIQQGGANLADALALTPGVASTSFAAGAGRPVIRGMDANRVKVLEDGLSSSDVSDIGPDHGVPIDPLGAQKIEVVRGAATLRYGSQAIGGVVNAINNRIPTTLPDKPLSGEATAAYGSAADTREGSILLDARTGQFAFHADGFGRGADDYQIPGGRQDNSFDRSWGYSVGGSGFTDNGSRLGVAVQHMNSQYGIPSDTTYIDMRQTKVTSSGSLKLQGPITAINADVGYADYQHTENDPDGTVLTTFKNRELDSRVEALFGQMGFLTSSALGVQVQDRRFQALGEDSSYLFPAHTSTQAVFGFTEAGLGERAKLQAAVRVEHVDITGTPASDVPTARSFTPVSGSVGLLYDATSAIKLGLTLTSAARAPAQTELFARGGHDGPQTFETGDPTLKIERANSVEATIRSTLGKVRFEGSAWASFYQDYIFGQLTGRTCDDDGGCVDGDSGELRELNYTQRDARFYGFEGKGAIPIATYAAGTLEANVLGDYVRAQFTDGGGNVPRIPPYRIGGGLAWTSKPVDASFLVLGVGRQSDVGAFDTPTNGYIDVRAQVAWRPLASAPGFEVAVVGKNLADTVERNAVSFNKDLVVLPGRDVRVVLRTTF